MKKLLPILIVSLLSLVFLSGCGYTKPLVAADEYEINKDLLGIWLPPKEERKEGEVVEVVEIYKFSNTEYLIILNPDPVLAFRGYEIEFKEKKYLQLEMLFPYEVKEEEEEKTEEASESFGSDTENDTEEGDNPTSGNESKSDAQKEAEEAEKYFEGLCFGGLPMIEGECPSFFNNYDIEKQFAKQRFQIVQYNLSGNNLILKLLTNIEDVDSPANDINREGEDVFDEEEGYFERCSEYCDYSNSLFK